MSSLRIVSLVNTPADPATGSGYVITGYAEELRRRGHAVEVLEPSDYEPLADLHRARQYKQALGMAARVGRLVRGGPPDVLELWGGEAWLAALRLRRLRKRLRKSGRRFLVVARSNGVEPHCALHLAAAGRDGEGTRRRWYQVDQTPLFAHAFRAADAIVTVSAFDRHFALDQGYAAPERILAIPNPLPASYRASDRGGMPESDPGSDPNAGREPAIGFCGSWIPRKGIGLLCAALPEVLRAHPSWHLVLIGVGEGFRPLAHFPEDVADRVRVVARADRERDLPALYRRLSLLVMPSIYESFGLVAAEAMACGTPVVAPPTGFAADLEPDREVFSVPDRTPGTLADCLHRAITHPELRATVARGGRARAQALRWDTAAAHLEEAYLRWLAELRAA